MLYLRVFRVAVLYGLSFVFLLRAALSFIEFIYFSVLSESLCVSVEVRVSA